ncbi:liprin-beta-1-like [Sapajus apella]|uniref:Liprin-beta-1-like n=1 Tax=Sapajus apella TaxID=9515 RepID=A0A6J3ICR5_SAPAP|nr:liprin-beta-1-like [Sapajus apella]
MGSERLQYEKKLESTKDELATSKEQLEEKESEVKRLQEKLVCKMKGEGIEIVDRGATVFLSVLFQNNLCSKSRCRRSPSLNSAKLCHAISWCLHKTSELSLETAAQCSMDA